MIMIMVGLGDKGNLSYSDQDLKIEKRIWMSK